MCVRNAQSGNFLSCHVRRMPPDWWTGRHVLESWAAMLKAGNMLENVCHLDVWYVCRCLELTNWFFSIRTVEPSQDAPWQTFVYIEHGRICRIWIWIIESRANYLPDLAHIYNAFTRFPLLRIRMSQRPRPKLCQSTFGACSIVIAAIACYSLQMLAKSNSIATYCDCATQKCRELWKLGSAWQCMAVLFCKVDQWMSLLRIGC